MRKSALALSTLLCASLLSSGSVSASVVLSGTRVIYDSSLSEKSVQLSNEDATPNLMQVWADSGDENSTPDKADAPFLVTPPVFRMEPKSGQTVRLIFTGKDLPQDRESLYFLNTIQIPQIDMRKSEQNQMVVMLRNRLKLFYRPPTIVGTAEAAPSLLRFNLSQKDHVWHVTVNNPTGFHVSLTGGKLLLKDKELPFTAEMVAPFSSASWPVSSLKQAAVVPGNVTFSYVNDYGGVSEGKAAIAP
ncbi:molecular chaperone [Neisseriaceae bacterium TC5R-5]|nr:molecular chaperone [Neisseriaceae bacterium TC5R-5]